MGRPSSKARACCGHHNLSHMELTLRGAPLQTKRFKHHVSNHQTARDRHPEIHIVTQRAHEQIGPSKTHQPTTIKEITLCRTFFDIGDLSHLNSGKEIIYFEVNVTARAILKITMHVPNFLVRTRGSSMALTRPSYQVLLVGFI